MNAHDSAYSEQGYLTFKDRWLLLLNDVDVGDLENYVVNITHLTIYGGIPAQKVRVLTLKCPERFRGVSTCRRRVMSSYQQEFSRNI